MEYKDKLEEDEKREIARKSVYKLTLMGENIGKFDLKRNLQGWKVPNSTQIDYKEDSDQEE